MCAPAQFSTTKLFSPLHTALTSRSFLLFFLLVVTNVLALFPLRCNEYNYILQFLYYFSEDASIFQIVAGEHSISNDSGLEQIKKVDSYLMHPEYSPTTLENDIALIYVSSILSHEPCYAIYCKRHLLP